MLGPVAMIQWQRVLPHMMVLSCLVLTTVLSALGMQSRASRRLGVPIRFGAKQVWSLLSGQTEPQTKAAFRNGPITDEPTWFCGDSKLHEFFDCEGISSNAWIYWIGACHTADAMDHLRDASAARLVIFHLGAGDSLLDPSGEMTRRNYRAILDRLADKKVLVLLPEPINNAKAADTILGGLDNRRLADMRRTITSVCAEYSNVRTLDFTPRMIDASGETRSELVADDIHLTGPAYDIWWEMMRDKLRGWVEER